MTGALLFKSEAEAEEASRDELVQNWFLIPEGFNERKHTDDVKTILRMLQPKTRAITDFTILTTTDCNARCFYCYELGIKRLSMTEETARDVAQYMIRACQGKPIKIRWFGGEPLYNSRVIDIICATLRDDGVSYESSMVTNGYYLDAPSSRKAIDEWHLKKVQITLDGTEAIYNRTKAYIDGEENPYARVMANIESALQAGIDVSIRLNMDARNADDLLLLLDDVKARFEGRESLEIYIALLHEFSGKIHRYESEITTEQAYFALRTKAESMGKLRKRPLSDNIKNNNCMADNDACETILPDGRIGRCEHFSEAMVTGDIWTDKRDEAVGKRWKEPLRVPECEDCVLYPQCRKLKLCEWNREGCNELDRRIKINELKMQILSAYQEYKEGVSK